MCKHLCITEHKSNVRLFLVVMESQHKKFKQKAKDHIGSYNSTIGGGDGYSSCGQLALTPPNLIEMSTSFLMAVVKLLRKTVFNQLGSCVHQV